MYFKQFLDEHCGCASYLIASRQTREAAVVDPALDIAQYLAIAAERGFRFRYAVDTHVHADHISGARKLREATGAEVCLHESARVRYALRGVRDGEELPLGQLRLRIVHTPGHRPELISVLVVNPPRSPEPSMVLTGDCLLVGDVGRPDFGGGDAEAQRRSVERLLSLPDWVAVFPGHFEGPCGKGMCGRPSTTIGFERLFNPMVRLDASAFVRTLSGEVPPRPLNMVAIEATNRGEADAFWAMPTVMDSVPEIAIADASAYIQREQPLLLDMRESSEFSAGHIPGAVLMPQAELAMHLSDIPHDRPVLTVCAAGARSLRTAQFLQQMGYTNVRSLAGGTSGWAAAGLPIDKTEGAPEPTRRIVESAWTHAGVHEAATAH